MSTVAVKSSTDLHWNQRAQSVARDVEVNIMDIFQRELEYEYICKHLTPQMNILEIGCGNGFSTERFRAIAKHVDAFDYAESMIDRAKERVGEKNNRFFTDNVLAPQNVSAQYDAVICVRVLINLRNLEEQHLALTNMSRWVKPGGLLILAEGYTEGFEALSKQREKLGMPPVVPAAINRYYPKEQVVSVIGPDFKLTEEFHLGAYDYLTRVVYPQIVGPTEAKPNTNFSEKCAELARAFNPECYRDFSRIRGHVWRKQ
jgi:ubiquinone/menaquinone biosynthesis C-methylase UbiE